MNNLALPKAAGPGAVTPGRADSSFARTFGGAPEVTVSAPGRVNLIGEHTDYHQGFVLPLPLPLRTTVRVRRRADSLVRAYSAAMQPALAEYRLGDEATGLGWIDYLQGVTALLTRTGQSFSGLEIAIESALPPGGGVSSSAALTVAVLRALHALNDLRPSDVAIAALAHQVETDFIGAPVGIMDPMACSVGRPGEALFLDTRSRAFERLPWPPGIDLMVINSGIAHAHAGGEYVTRRRESFMAAERLGVRWLRDAGEASLPRVSMPEVLRRRARHVITENQRVLDAVTALRRADARRLGALFNASHASMRDDYEASVPAIDALVEIGQADPDVYGARLTGGGFGGCVVMLTAAGRALDAAQRIVATYRTTVGLTGSILMPANQRATIMAGSADQ